MLEVTEEILAASEYFYNPANGVFGRAWTRAEFEAVGDDPDSNDYRNNGGYIFGDWASAGYPQGEGGSNHVTRVIPISREAYEKAKAVDWDIDVVIVGII
jgi:hypothetical protein